MAEQPNIQSILAALSGQKAPLGGAIPQQQPAGIDISHIRPVHSGYINIAGPEKSRTPNDRGRYRSRSRSPRREYDARYRSRSPRRESGGQNSHVETLKIDSSLVGLVIGRQGENMRRVESETGARVQFITNGPSGPTRDCKISGTERQVREARDAIYKIIEENQPPGKLAGASTPAPQQQQQQQQQQRGDTLQIMVPDRTVGLIIGRGGETIRDLQERSGCHINIVGENKSVNGLRPVNLIGSPQAAAMAKDLIMEIVDSDVKGVAQPVPDAKINETIMVPSDSVGLVIGKGGETIREIQTQSGCKVNVNPNYQPGDRNREIGLVGTRDAIDRAKGLIEERISGVRRRHAGGEEIPSNSYGQEAQPAQAAAAPADDPYAAYGGYQNYLALWYSAMTQQQEGDKPAS